jgi:hypothetical protein
MSWLALGRSATGKEIVCLYLYCISPWLCVRYGVHKSLSCPFPVHMNPIQAPYLIASVSPSPIRRGILFHGENISFDASLVVYINSNNVPPIMIINRIYEHQNLLSL